MKRRNFLGLGAAEQPAELSATSSAITTPSTPINVPNEGRITSTTLRPFAPTSAEALDYRKAAHLLRRCVVGVRDSEIRQAVSDGLEKTLERLFTPFEPSYARIQSWVGKEPQVRPPQGSQQGTPEYDSWLQTMITRRTESAKWWLQVISTSPVSIQERMVLFWHNHFVTESDVVNFGEFMVTQNQLLRRHALGNFKTFTREITTDNAMLVYLDGVRNFKTNRATQINENYARELQELFTLGVTDRNGNPNYTQKDVSEAARALSGWAIGASSQGTLYQALTSTFRRDRWDAGTKTFLGRTGAWNTDDIITIIFEQKGEQVAKFLCEKLYKAFVYDVPDYAIVDGLAATFRANNFEIKPVLQQLFRSEHFYDPSHIGAMPKSPTDYVVGAIRSLNLTNITDFSAQAVGRTSNPLSDRLNAMGQLVNNAPNVKGWQGGRTWISTSTLPLRQQFILDVMDAKITSTSGRTTQTLFQFDPIAFARTFPNPDNLRQLTTDMTQFLLNVPPSQAEFDRLFATIVDGGRDYEWSLTDPTQRAGERIKKFLKAVAQLAKYQLM